ncbi:hypothetical protein SAMN05216571_10819 [Onishia taeanensis]|uniref:Uncharacterized protein n=1 Tax=Onishia taeanensis TaxID=284577 RepID=A0A1G7SWL2_9GAMM|nr:hypothetical protein [Halomonas taeanensis]SDG27443.1 hypothetical protein SAMN05216571_10819 [Halomonas taeanensis]
MPEEAMHADDRLEALLEKVRQRENLDTTEQAAEWLLRRRLRKGVAGLTGRGRALHAVPTGGRR